MLGRKRPGECVAVRVSCYLGLASYAAGVATILAAIAVNPWFSVWSGALSDMGRVGLPTAWVFNTGLKVAAALAASYAPCLLMAFKKSLTHLAAGVYLTAVANLFLIGAFPEGTKPHWIVSYEFFTLMMAVYALMAPALWVEGLRRHAVVNAALFAAALCGSATLHWPSTAVLELYNIGLMGVWYAVMAHATLARRAVSGRCLIRCV